MSISAAEASRLTGKSKQAIINAIKLGKISAIKDIDGTWQIEPVELFRVYTPLSTLDTKLDTTISQELDGTSQALDTLSVATLQVEVRMLRELLDAKGDVIAAKDDTIADLRTRLDVEQEERRRLSMLLAAPQPELPAPVEPPPPERKRSWWARLLGG
jgi:hypothetical protein